MLESIGYLTPDIKAGRGHEIVEVERLTGTKYRVSVVWDHGQDKESKDVSVQSLKAPKDSTRVSTIDYAAGNCVFFVMSLFVWFVDIELSADRDRNFGIINLPIRAESTLGEPLLRFPGSLCAG
ncbi:uncharacterized protein Bfra_000037 [Botrytis fragariae]|uniref:Uncharacterized protein n=1 Tax=Botrytis fragariae TaxID=1964551 RepID=A0A8H6EN08_9HELO|nr:uncharacterized protein Bfra_000037 [Botrytis fragariae]KAF5877875.1 hypothetical protein Bfra_000037 [Botrytis fragariae]